MADNQFASGAFALDENGFLVPPPFDGQPAHAFESRRDHAQEVAYSSPALAELGWQRPPSAREAAAPPQQPAGRLNWVFGALAIVTGLASFVWPLVCLTVLVGLALSAVGISRANRLARRGANGRGIAIVGLVIGLASAANLVFGFSSLFELQSQLSSLLP
ncbi:DUF4190 domain-containing protein [Gryllotalpicola koreensis]